MLITPQGLNVFFTALETRFWSAYDLAPLFYPKVATTYPVGSEIWLSGWLNMVDKMREWVGPRIVRTPAPQTYQVPVKPFELTEEIDRFKIADDMHGIYYPAVDFMGMQAKKAPDYQFRDLIQNTAGSSWTGNFQLGTDQLTHWNTAHPVDVYDASKGTYPNDYSGGGISINGVTVGGGLAANSFATVWEDMARRKSESGEAQRVRGALLFAGVMLKATAMFILEAQFLGLPVIGNLGTGNLSATGSPANANQAMVGSSDNMFRNWSDLAIWEDLGGSATLGNGTMDSGWYLVDNTKPVMPFSYLHRMDTEFAFMVEPDNPVVFSTHKYVYGAVNRFAVAWGLPFLSSRSSP